MFVVVDVVVGILVVVVVVSVVLFVVYLQVTFVGVVATVLYKTTKYKHNKTTTTTIVGRINKETSHSRGVSP